MKLVIKVYDDTYKKIFCKIQIEKVVERNNQFLQDRFETIYCTGTHVFQLEKGQYKVHVYKGKLYYPYNQSIDIDKKDIELTIQLKRIVDTKSLNLYCFDAHSHVSRDEKLDTGDLYSASTVMKGEDFNFFFAGSPYDHEVHLQYLNKNFTDKIPYREKFADVINQVNDESFILDIGNEIVKCRYGHAFMMNYNQRPPFSKYYDEDWDPWMFNKVGEEPSYRIPYMYEALLAERDENSVAIAAHPTSWWWHDNGEFITNIASTLGFEILAGSIDAMVVMGYGRDHKYYQELWFEALRNGYFLPGIAETDVSFDRPPEKFLEFKTYAIIDSFNIDSLCRSVRDGRCIVTSGPIVLISVNGQYPGAVIKHSKGEKFIVQIDAYRCYQAALSKIQILVNGRVYKEYDLNHDMISIVEEIQIDDDSFLIAKCYDYEGNLGMTDPVYIRNVPFLNIGYKANVFINIFKDGRNANGIYWLDENSERNPFNGSIKLMINVACRINIQVCGQVKTIRLFELDEIQKVFKNLYLGGFNAERKYKPGEVPASEFKLDTIRKILDNVEINLGF